jgi:AcrR family transcriptional regulator
MTRKYDLKRRAERQEETRRRILDATVAVHERYGIPGTTISAVAEEAEVERLTVYRHFPDESALLTAATSHYLEAHPPPNPEPWRNIADPVVRLHVGLTAAYDYHQRTERMLGRLIQGMPFKPIICDALETYAVHWRAVQQILAIGWDAPNPAIVMAAVGHSLAFTTWHSLVRDLVLDNTQAVEMMVGTVRSCAEMSPE